MVKGPEIIRCPGEDASDHDIAWVGNETDSRHAWLATMRSDSYSCRVAS